MLIAFAGLRLVRITVVSTACPQKRLSTPLRVRNGPFDLNSLTLVELKESLIFIISSVVAPESGNRLSKLYRDSGLVLLEVVHHLVL